MNIGQWMVTSIPSTITGVQTPHGGDLVVDDTKLLVMREVVHEFTFLSDENLNIRRWTYLRYGLGDA
jgi:hypothetical protein